tara:strand:- start:696 stop:1208 length:513 start_codon:yes stop_codon:yes gene_type:complete
MRHHKIFPSSLWHIEGAPQPLVEDLYQAAYKIRKNHKSESVSNKGGYQSPMFKFKDFHPEAIKYIESILEKIPRPPTQVDGWWWYNINGKGHWNAPHTHPKCDYALVWYLTDSNGLLNLLTPFPQRVADKGDNITINGKKGDIVIFPSDIIHFVLPNPKDEDRVCISMNL